MTAKHSKAVTRTARKGPSPGIACFLSVFDNQYIKDGKDRTTTGDGQLLKGDGERAVQHPQDHQERLQQVETEAGAGSVPGERSMALI